jgi:hypothetical protein
VKKVATFDEKHTRNDKKVITFDEKRYGFVWVLVEGVRC